jgi:hypothetical protein
MSMVGLWNHTIARQLLLELPALVTNVSWRLAHNDINEAILLTRQQPRKQQWVPEGSANFHDAGEKAAAQHRSDLWHRSDAPRLPSGGVSEDSRLNPGDALREFTREPTRELAAMGAAPDETPPAPAAPAAPLKLP